MNFDKILDDCVTLEGTITALVNSTAEKKRRLNQLQNTILQESAVYLEQLLNREDDLQREFEKLRMRKEELETDIEKHTYINDQLSKWVTAAQKISDDRLECQDKSNEVLAQTAETIFDYETVKSDYLNICKEIVFLRETLEKRTEEVKKLVRENNELVVDLHKNDSIMRFLQQHNKYSEQQFDLILNLLPYEPLTKANLEEIRSHKVELIRNLADVLEIQANEINDLNESYNMKQAKKLEILEQLAEQLNTFVRKREEAIMIELYK